MAETVNGPDRLRAGEEAGTSSQQAKILLVDDRADNLLALSAILSSLGHALVQARSGEEALKAMLTDDFALVILDVQMPGMDGYATATHIKRRERTRSVPIVFLTATYSDSQDAFRGYAAGAVDYITKPFDPWVLRAKVSVFVDLYLKNRQLREQAALLRTLLGGATGPMASQQLLNELSTRLASVEEQAALLREQVEEQGGAPAGDGSGPAGGDAADLAGGDAARLAGGDAARLAGGDAARLAETARVLEERVARLRLALDVLRPD